MKRALFAIIQATWGLPQTLVGLAAFLASAQRPHFMHHGAIVTKWKGSRGVSLGLFLFVPDPVDDQLLVHEYGHAVQSLVLGPLYLPIVGIPSLIWSKLPALNRRRGTRGTSYYDFRPERNASALGERVLGRPAMR